MGTGWLAGGAPGGRRRLGEVLVAGKVLTDAQLNEALRVQREDKGLRMVESEHPDLILVDLDLPGADPSELLAILRTGARDTPVLFMSADDDHHTRDRAIASGATGFIPKPISQPQLRSEVTAVLQHRAALVDHRA